MQHIYDLTDYTTELDAEARELEQEDYEDWLDTLNEEEFLEEMEKPGSMVQDL